MNALLAPCFRLIFITSVLVATVLVSPANAGVPVLTSIHSFSGVDGAAPTDGLVAGTNGKLYGTTSMGGSGNAGTVFDITTQGTLTIVHSFSITTYGPGVPYGGLVMGASNTFYGTAYIYGGVQADKGAVFQVSPTGLVTDMFSFNGADGNAPASGLTLGSDGTLYGTTASGGANGDGTAFNITTSGTETTLHSFAGTDGSGPVGGLIQGSDGDFYGTTRMGGLHGYGTVFKMTPSGTLTTLHSFGGADGSNPVGTLIEGADQDFYGTTSAGGPNNGSSAGHGTLFKISPAGTLTTLFSFTGGAEGNGPDSGLIIGPDGNFYGTASGGGANGAGTLFSMTPAGALTILHSFTGGDGANPIGNLLLASDGNFYGTTAGGGLYGQGTVYMFTLDGAPPLTPTSTMLQSSASPAARTTAVVFTATITPSVPDGETITFYDGANVIGTGATTGSSASFSTSVLLGGAHSISAIYPGDATFAASASSAVAQVISRTPTTTTVSSSQNPSPVGAPVTFTATIQPTVFNGDAVTFYDGSALLGTAKTAGGVATLTVSSLGVGTHAVSASYGGDSSFSAGPSPPVNQSIFAAIHTFAPGLTMISVPTSYSGEPLSTVLGYANPVLATWVPSVESYAVSPTPPADSLAPGIGYWIRFPQSAAITSAGSTPTLPLTIALAKGWNLIGCPETSAVPIATLSIVDSNNATQTFSAAAANGLVGATLYAWQSGDTTYETVPAASGALNPYDGYWLDANQPCTLSFPAPG